LAKIFPQGDDADGNAGLSVDADGDTLTAALSASDLV
jgi:hypothetical protein